MRSLCTLARFSFLASLLSFPSFASLLFSFLPEKKDQDFIHAARTYGRIIISEVYLPMRKKTIKPLNLGGVAGGDKYVVHNVLYKFAVDSAGLFGGNNLAAAKVGGLELKGLVSYFRSFCYLQFFFSFSYNIYSYFYSAAMNDINLPMMTLVDYRGFRLIAMSLLPIQGDSLIYGSKDAGLTVHASDPEFNGLMKKAGQELNLAPHLCGSQTDDLKELWGACDIEGHYGTDGLSSFFLSSSSFSVAFLIFVTGKFYLLDFSRTMPPVAPRKDLPQGHLYRLFRREFVQSYKRLSLPFFPSLSSFNLPSEEPLCSDGFSSFCKLDPNFKTFNEELKQATNHLLYDVIPGPFSLLPLLVHMFSHPSYLVRLRASIPENPRA